MESEVLIMTQQNEEHFEVIEKNKVERYERQKLTYLEDRMKDMEKAIESHAKILARFQMTEGDNSLTINIFAKVQRATSNLLQVGCRNPQVYCVLDMHSLPWTKLLIGIICLSISVVKVVLING